VLADLRITINDLLDTSAVHSAPFSIRIEAKPLNKHLNWFSDALLDFLHRGVFTDGPRHFGVSPKYRALRFESRLQCDPQRLQYQQIEPFRNSSGMATQMQKLEHGRLMTAAPGWIQP
jgi:hypothetical protein